MQCYFCNTIIMNDYGKLLNSGYVYLDKSYTELDIGINVCYPVCANLLIKKPTLILSPQSNYMIENLNKLEINENEITSKLLDNLRTKWNIISDTDKFAYNQKYNEDILKYNEELDKFKKQFVKK